MKDIIFYMVYITSQWVPLGPAEEFKAVPQYEKVLKVKYFEVDPDSVDHYRRAFQDARDFSEFQEGWEQHMGNVFEEEKLDTFYILEYYKD